MTKTFDDKFPELTLKVQVSESLQDMCYSMQTMERLLEDIDKYCLSKQRVKEALDLAFDDTTQSFLATKRKMRIIKELGLEGE